MAEEMAQKFDIVFATTDDPLFSADPDRFWRGSFIIASIHRQKAARISLAWPAIFTIL